METATVHNEAVKPFFDKYSGKAKGSMAGFCYNYLHPKNPGRKSSVTKMQV